MFFVSPSPSLPTLDPSTTPSPGHHPWRALSHPVADEYAPSLERLDWPQPPMTLASQFSQQSRPFPRRNRVANSPSFVLCASLSFFTCSLSYFSVQWRCGQIWWSSSFIQLDLANRAWGCREWQPLCEEGSGGPVREEQWCARVRGEATVWIELRGLLLKK